MNAIAPATGSVFLAFVRAGILRMLAYRVRYLIGVVNYVLYVAVAYFLWRAVYSARAGADIADYDLGGLITYVAIGWLVRAAYFNNVDRELANRFVKGTITSDMVRPASLYVMFYGDAVGEALFRFGVMTLPCAAIILPLFPIDPPADAQAAVLFTISILLAFHIFFCLNFLTGLLGFHFESLDGFLWAKFNVMQLLSGVLFPIAFLPFWAQSVLAALPFQHIGYTPLRLYLGKVEGADLWQVLGVQAAWALLLWALCEWGWRRARQALTIQGG